MITKLGEDIAKIKHWFAEVDILSEANKQELMHNVNYAYNQVDRLDNRIQEMLDQPEWNQMKWDNITVQRDKRQLEFEHLLKAYNKEQNGKRSPRTDSVSEAASDIRQDSTQLYSPTEASAKV